MKPEVNDTQRKVIMNTLYIPGYEDIKTVRDNKLFEIKINSEDGEYIKKEIDEVCDKVLENPNIEAYPIKP